MISVYLLLDFRQRGRDKTAGEQKKCQWANITAHHLFLF